MNPLTFFNNSTESKHLQQMRTLWKDTTTADLTLVVGQDKVLMKAHMCILKVTSPSFEAMFSSGEWKESKTRTVQIPSLTLEAVGFALGFMYMGHITLAWIEVQEDRDHKFTTAIIPMLARQWDLVEVGTVTKRVEDLITIMRQAQNNQYRSMEDLVGCAWAWTETKWAAGGHDADFAVQLQMIWEVLRAMVVEADENGRFDPPISTW
ncbi:hypothetical protein HDV00_000888 [Rhizophlyctis rosea]|nr:hypothetical protein HDV00_000888 [Rhizophlyctis rosea]